jgi:hypothetical protein
LQVICTPFARPVTAIGDPDPAFVTVPHFAWYPVIGPVPVLAGGEKLTFAVPLALAPAFTFVGAPGGVAAVEGVALFDGADSNELPLALAACTVQVTAVPFGTVTEIGDTVLVPV